YRIAPTVESRSSLFHSLAGHGYREAYSARDNGSNVLSVAFSPDGKTLAFGTRGAKIFLLDAASGTQRAVLSNHRHWVWGLAFSSDGKTLISGSWDKTLISWDVASGQAIGLPFSGHVGEVQSVAISPDGRTVASGSWDKTMILWDVATHQPIGEPL